MNYRAWQLKNADTAGESALLAAGYGPLLARVLACRGIAQPQAAAALLEEEPPLSDPFLLKDMDKAVARIQQAIENGETIVIFGDYDVDGVSATAILYECLTNLGAQVRCKLPTREGGGYGLNRETLQKLADKGYKLIVTVDNGISAIEEADLAAELGIELVITDHHLPAQQQRLDGQLAALAGGVQHLRRQRRIEGLGAQPRQQPGGGCHIDAV